MAGTIASSPLYAPTSPSKPMPSPKPDDGLSPDAIAKTFAQSPAPALASKAKHVPEAGPLRIAILLNSYRSRILPAIRASYQRTIGAVAPDAQLAFYEPANRPGEFPDPDYFDLVVIGGSNVDPRKRHPWILEVHAFVRRVVRDYPHKKLLGICWGHQTISSVFGGRVADAATPEVSRTRPILSSYSLQVVYHGSVRPHSLGSPCTGI